MAVSHWMAWSRQLAISEGLKLSSLATTGSKASISPTHGIRTAAVNPQVFIPYTAAHGTAPRTRQVTTQLRKSIKSVLRVIR
jgi:hypothetical protein